MKKLANIFSNFLADWGVYVMSIVNVLIWTHFFATILVGYVK